jgi:hypothetical protein
MAVPAHCTAALRIVAAAAAAAAVGASVSASAAAAAADGGTGATRQPVDQILLLPTDRQSKLGAELLQLRDGLHVRENSQRESVVLDRPPDKQVACTKASS